MIKMSVDEKSDVSNVTSTNLFKFQGKKMSGKVLFEGGSDSYDSEKAL